MTLDTAIMIGVLFSCAVYLILQRQFTRILFGFVLLSNAVNLLILGVSGHTGEKVAPILRDPSSLAVDPLPQALILTAIVIGFGVTAYLVFLMYRLFLDYRTTDIEKLFDDLPESKKEEKA